MPPAANDRKRVLDRIAAPLAVLISLGWAISLGYAILGQNVTPLEVVSPPFLMMCGAVFGVRLVGPGRRQ